MSFDISAENVFLAMALLAPGVLIIYFRSRFSPNPAASLPDIATQYVALSLVYAATWVPLFSRFVIVENSISLISWYLFVLLLPCILGLVSGYMKESEKLYDFLKKYNLSLPHPRVTAWEYKFSRIKPCYAIITLVDGATYYCYIGENSFISSSTSHKDIYVDGLCDFSEGKWKEIEKPTQLLICPDKVKTIQFIESE